MSYPNQPGMPPFGGQPQPQPQPAPVKPVSGKTIALVAAGIAAVGALIIGLIVGLSSGDDENTTRVTLIDYSSDYGATVSLRVPAGWQLVEDSVSDDGFALVRGAESMTFDEIEAVWDGLRDGTETTATMEVLTVWFGECPNPEYYNHLDFDADREGWQAMHPTETDTSGQRQDRTASLAKVVGDDLCLGARGMDVAPVGATLPDGAEKLLEKLRDGQVITKVKLIPNAGASTSPSRGR